MTLPAKSAAETPAATTKLTGTQLTGIKAKLVELTGYGGQDEMFGKRPNWQTKSNAQSNRIGKNIAYNTRFELTLNASTAQALHSAFSAVGITEISITPDKELRHLAPSHQRATLSINATPDLDRRLDAIDATAFKANTLRVLGELTEAHSSGRY